MTFSFNNKVNSYIICFTSIGILTAFVLVKWFIFSEEQADITTRIFTATLILIIDLSLLISMSTLTYFKLSGRGCFTLTQKGIEKTFLIFNIFTLMIILPIKFIPWSAVSNINSENQKLIKAKINTKIMDNDCCVNFAKLLLHAQGYCFGYGFTDVDEADIQKYMIKAAE